MSIDFIRFATGVAYYGLNLASEMFSGHLHRDYILGTLVEIPALIFMSFLTNRYTFIFVVPSVNIKAIEATFFVYIFY